MKEIRIANGLETYTLNGVCEIKLNPTDSFFIERLYSVFETLDKKQSSYEAAIRAAKQGEIFDLARQQDKEMRELIDGTFEMPICDTLFKDMSMYSLADGLPLWANLLLAILDELDESFAREQKLTNPRVEKYTKKYKR